MKVPIAGLSKEPPFGKIDLFSLLEFLPSATVVLDSVGLITYLNCAAVELLGGSQEELEGREFPYPVELHASADIESSQQVIGSKRVHLRYLKIDLDATHTTLVQFRIVSESTPDALSVVTDKDMKLFSRAVSHDINLPLRNIQMIAEWIKEDYADVLDAAALRDLGLMIDNISRMHQLTKGLLQYMRIDAASVECESVRLDEVFGEVLDNLNTEVKLSDARIHYDSLPQLNADRSQIVILVEQIVSNCLKFRSQREVDITVSAEMKGDNWEVSVVDNGIGIEEKYLSRIFDPTFKIHSQTEYEGAGLGLAIAKKIVQLYGGSIYAESEIGAGSKFTFSIPV